MTELNTQIELIVSEIIGATRKAKNLEDLGQANTNGVNNITKLVKKLTLGGVSKRYFLFSGQEDCKPTKYLVDDCDDRETAIAKIETEYPNFKWVMTETFNAC